MTDAFHEPKARSVVIEKARLLGLRNLRPLELEFSPGLNIFTGNNGQGKTSILEALVLGMTSRSFRTEQAKEVIEYGGSEGWVEVQIAESGLLRQQRVILTRSRKNTIIDGKRVAKLADFATRTPVVVFHPADLTLVSGPAALRRTLLDRIGLYLDPMTIEDRRAYQQALRERQHLLTEKGIRASSLEAFEAVASAHGARLSRAHRSASESLLESLGPISTTLLPLGLNLGATYLGFGDEDPAQFAKSLADGRSKDLIRGRPCFGPHRDDLELLLGGAEARKHASQGQQRLFALVLKLAELRSIERARSQRPILVLDDVVSELDPHRTTAVLDWVSRIQSQVFVTATRFSESGESLFPSLPKRKFWVSEGVASLDS